MGFAQRVGTWRAVINTANLPAGVAMDRVSKSAAFVHTRRAGGQLIAGLLLNALLPVVRLPWM